MTETPAAVPFYAKGNFAPIEREFTEEHLRVEGAIPPELDGLYLRNGPNPVDHNITQHWFAGDGMLHGVDLLGGKARWYRNRYVQTSTFVEGRRGVASAAGKGSRNNSANTNVVAHAGKIFALVEDSLPTQVGATLDTVGEYDFNGKLATPCTAHPVICSATGELHFFGYSSAEPVVSYHVANAGGELVRSVEIAVSAPAMMHGFALTKHNAVFMDLPVIADEGLLVTGMPFRWSDNHGARVGLLKRGALEDAVRWFEVDPCYVFHPLNAYEDEEGATIVDVVRYDDLWRGGPGTKRFEPAYLHRWHIDPTGRVSEQRLDDRTIEFPRGDPRFSGVAHRYGYAIRTDETGSGIASGTIITYDVISGQSREFRFEEGTILSEFVMVPASARAGEGEGWLVGYSYSSRGDRSALVIMDAQRIEKGPVAHVWLPQRVPQGFHGEWIPREAMQA